MIKETEIILSKWMSERIEQLRTNYNSWGVKASGNFGASLSFKIKSYGAVLMGVDYSIFTDKGRRKGKFPPPNTIKRWIIDKGIAIPSKMNINQLAYLIGRKIAKKGVVTSSNRYGKSQNLIESVFNDDAIKEIKQLLVLSQIEPIKNTMYENFKKLER